MVTATETAAVKAWLGMTPPPTEISVPGISMPTERSAGAPAGVVPATGGAPAGPSGGTRPASPDWSFLVLMVGVFGLLILMTAMGGRKERRRRAQLLSSLKKQDRVQTTGGIIGTIVELKDDEVVLKVDEGKIRFTRSAVAAILREARGEPSESKSAAAD